MDKNIGIDSQSIKIVALMPNLSGVKHLVFLNGDDGTFLPRSWGLIALV